MHVAKQRYVALDIEGTGLSPANDRIIEFAARSLVTNGSAHECLHLKFNPGVRISPHAARVHGYTDVVVAGFPRFSVSAQAVSDFLADAIVVVHNYRCDIPLLQEELRRTFGSQYSLTDRLSGIICTLQASRQLLPGGSHTLSALGQRLGLATVTSRPAHSALNDTESLVEVFDALCLRFGTEQVLRAGKVKFDTPSDPQRGFDF